MKLSPLFYKPWSLLWAGMGSLGIGQQGMGGGGENIPVLSWSSSHSSLAYPLVIIPSCLIYYLWNFVLRSSLPWHSAQVNTGVQHGRSSAQTLIWSYGGQRLSGQCLEDTHCHQSTWLQCHCRRLWCDAVALLWWPGMALVYKQLFLSGCCFLLWPPMGPTVCSVYAAPTHFEAEAGLVMSP